MKSILDLARRAVFRWLDFVGNLSNITHHNSPRSKNDTYAQNSINHLGNNEGS